MRSELSPGVTRALLLVILAGAALLRFRALSYGLPFVYNPDEVAIMNRALAFGTGDLNPHNFLYPTFYFYVLFGFEVLGFAAGRMFGVFDSLAAFERSYFVDPTWIFLAGRTMTALCGVATVAATYVLGSRIAGRTAGFVAALAMAVAPVAVRDAHYVKHDVPVTLLVVLAAVVLVKPATDARARHAFWPWAIAGAVAGLAMSTHYYAIFLALPIAAAALWPLTPDEPLRDRARWLAIAGSAATLAFLAGSPYIVTDPGRLVTDVVGNRQIVIDRVTARAGALGSLGFYLNTLGGDGIGLGTAILALIGAIVAVMRRHTAILLLIFPIAFLLFISNTFPATRYVNPLLPFMAVLAGLAASGVSETASRGRFWVRVAFLVVLIAPLGASVSGRSNAFFLQADTRTQAYEWIVKNLPPASSVLVQPYSVPLRQSRDGLVEALRATRGSEQNATTRFQKQLALNPYPSPAYRTIYLGVGGLDQDKIYVAPDAFKDGTLDALRQLAVTHVILKRYNQPDPALHSLDRALLRDAQLIVTLSPYRATASDETRAVVPPFLHNTDSRIDPALERPGPIVEIWQIR